MVVYWCLFIFIIFFNLIPIVSKKNAEKKLIVSFILIFIYASIRVDFGLDYVAYEEEFLNIKNSPNLIPLDTNFEIGFVLLNKLMPSFRSLIIVLSAFTCITYYYLFKKYITPSFYWFAFLLIMLCNNYMLFFQLSGLRNAVAVNILALSLGFVKDRKIIPYTILVIVAYGFHTSTIFIMPLIYFVANPKSIKKSEIVIWIILALFLAVSSSTSFIGVIQSYINIYFERYSTYVDIAKEAKDEKGILLYGFSILMIILTLYVAKKEKFSAEGNIILKLSLLFIFSLLLGVLNFRMSQFLAPFFIIGSIYFINSKVKPILKAIYLVAVLLFLAYNFFIVFMGSEYFAYDKYYNIFTDL